MAASNHATYQLWHSENEATYAFFKKGDQTNLALLESDSKLIWETDADSWEEASAKKRAYLGWDGHQA